MRYVDRATQKALAEIPARLRDIVRENDVLLRKVRQAASNNDWDDYDVAATMFLAHAAMASKALDDAHAILLRVWPSSAVVQ